MKQALSILALASSLTGVAYAENVPGCYEQMTEVNASSDPVGVLNTNRDEIEEILPSHRIFYQADDIIVCTTAGGQMISGLEFVLGPYMRDDYDYVPR